MRSVNKKDIAIVSMAAVMPQANNLKEYWSNLFEGIDCIREFPVNRKKDIADYVRFLGEKENYIKAGYLERIDQFDNRFFNLTPKEAMLMSPSQRIILETAYKAFTDAGYDRQKLNKSRTGVYVGYIGDNEGSVYRNMLENLTDEFSSVAMSGNLSSIIAGRISYTFNLTGPCMLIDTACSSSLVALYTACRDIRNGLCDMALAGAVKLCMLPLDSKEKIGIESSDNKTRTFDEHADGTGIGEGCGAVVVKSLARAERDGDYIYAVIKGGYVNQDGASSGITAPNPAAQRDLYWGAWKDAGIDPETISYIEAHGTGTTLGDPIEIEGLTGAFKKYTDKTQFCAIGSVKTNIGHLYEAAGIASVIKTVLALNFGKIPKSLHFEMPNPQIDFIHSPFYVSGETSDWQKNGDTCVAGVSAFGFSGTNCHLILEEYTGRAKPYMESIEEKLEKSTTMIFDEKRFWFQTKYMPVSCKKKVKEEHENHVKLSGKKNISELEQKIGDMWSKYMGYEELNVFDDFFRLGGDSILAAKIVADIQKSISGKVKPSDMFTYPTIAAIAEQIEHFHSGRRQQIRRLPEASCYKCSAEQQRLYIVYQIENRDGTYNMPFVAEFDTIINHGALGRAIKTVVDRHETLRTCFFEQDGQIWQKIEPCLQWKPEFESIKETELEAKLMECLHPFDLEKAPLIRTKIFETESRTILFVDMHHIISDGTSMGLFIKEVMAVYRGEQLPELEVQYKDFSAWQEEFLKSEEVKRQEQFWQDTFADGIPLIRLPQDFAHPSNRTTRGGSYSFAGTESERNAVELCAQKHACTSFVVLLAAYFIMLHKFSMQNCIVVGSPVSGRTHYQAANMIGMFVNMMPFMTKIEDDMDVSLFIDQTKALVYRVYENQECQFETIARLNVKNRVAGRNPVMDVIFAYQNMELPSLVLDGNQAKCYSLNQDSKYDLMLEIYDDEKGFRMRFEYYKEIFRENTIKEFADEYNRILDAMTGNGQKETIADLCYSGERSAENISIDFDF
ncbi:MAG: condensation domain-containing protein [Clostridiales bacterium]|nr:condensation domain-containing protein [Clostridiales bacterium]